MLSPITILTSSLNPGNTANSTFVTSNETTLTYTSTNTTIYYGSTTGTTTVQVAAHIPPKGIGFMAVKGECADYSLPMTVTSGTTLNILMTSNSPVSFYLFPTYSFQPSANGCRIIGDAILTVSNFTTYNLHWTAEDSGTFYFLFTAPNAILILMDQGSTKPIQQVANITVATSTGTSVWSFSTVSTSTVTTTEEATQPLYLQTSTQYMILIGITISLVAFALALRGRHKTSHVAPSEMEFRNPTS
jgi:hypothetical protein